MSSYVVTGTPLVEVFSTAFEDAFKAKLLCFDGSQLEIIDG